MKKNWSGITSPLKGSCVGVGLDSTSKLIDLMAFPRSYLANRKKLGNTESVVGILLSIGNENHYPRISTKLPFLNIYYKL